MKRLASVLATLDRRRARVLAELHPELDALVRGLCTTLGGRLTPWEGYRDQQGQEAALAAKTSQARWLESPHNYRPALGCDLVLDPRHVAVRAHPDDAETPWLWDVETPAALAAWEALEQAALAAGLERVLVHGARDRPHVQLAHWHSRIPH